MKALPPVGDTEVPQYVFLRCFDDIYGFRGDGKGFSRHVYYLSPWEFVMYWECLPLPKPSKAHDANRDPSQAEQSQGRHHPRSYGQMIWGEDEQQRSPINRATGRTRLRTKLRSRRRRRHFLLEERPRSYAAAPPILLTAAATTCGARPIKYTATGGPKRSRAEGASLLSLHAAMDPIAAMEFYARSSSHRPQPHTARRCRSASIPFKDQDQPGPSTAAQLSTELALVHPRQCCF